MHGPDVTRASKLFTANMFQRTEKPILVQAVCPRHACETPARQPPNESPPIASDARHRRPRSDSQPHAVSRGTATVVDRSVRFLPWRHSRCSTWATASPFGTAVLVGLLTTRMDGRTSLTENRLLSTLPAGLGLYRVTSRSHASQTVSMPSAYYENRVETVSKQQLPLPTRDRPPIGCAPRDRTQQPV